MKFTINYWYTDMSDVTGYARGDEITMEQLNALIETETCNIMILRTPDRTYCNIDSGRFNQR